MESEETIDLKELFLYFKDKIGFIVLITAVLGLLGCIYAMFIQIPIYESSSSIILISNDNNNNITNNEIVLNKNLVSTYAKVVKSKRVINQVNDNLNLNYDYEKLCDEIEVSSEDGTEIIIITAADKSKVKAKEIANETAEVFKKEISKLYNISNVNVLDVAEIAEKPANINVLKETIISLMIGFILSCGVIFLLFYFDRTIKKTEQIEKLGLPVLGTVQDNDSKGGNK